MTRSAPVLRVALGVLVLVVLVAGHAAAQGLRTTTDFSGKRVVAVEFQAPRTVDARGLRYLVDLADGELYNAQGVRRSVQRLFRLGQFDDVQARVRPVPYGVRVTFVLVPSPRIVAIRIQGARRLSGTVVRAALSRTVGDPYIQEDEVRLARQAEQQVRARGFLDATVTARITTRRSGGKVVELRVDEGQPYRVADLRFLPEELSGFSKKRLLELVSPRLKVGHIYREEDLVRAVPKLLDSYRRAGYVEARLLRFGARSDGRLPVDVQVNREAKTVSISLPVEAGRHAWLEFEFEGARLPQWTDGRLKEVIGLVTAHRVSDSYAAEAGRQLERFLRRRGFRDAHVDTLVSESAADEVTGPSHRQPRPRRVRNLVFKVQTGPRVILRRADIHMQGNEAVTDSDIVRVLSDASPEVLGHRSTASLVLGLPIYRRFYTKIEMEAALSVLRDYYRARGFLDVGLEHEVEVLPAEGAVRTRRLRLSLSVNEGTRTEVEGLDLAVPVELDRRLQAGWRRRLAGRPFNPAAVDLLAAEARHALAELGYVDAEVEVLREFSDDRSLVRLTVTAEPGASVRFGQVLVRENRHTHVGLIRREVPVQAGDIYRPSVLQAAQGRLLRSGLFRQIEIGSVQSIGRVRDVEVIASERNRFSFVLGAGVTAPDDGPRMSGEARLRNLDGRGFSVWSRGRIHIDWRYLEFDVVPRPEYRASLGAELPYIPGVPLRGTISLVLNEELDEPTFRVARSSVALAMGLRGARGLNLDARLEVQLRAPLRVDPAAQLNSRFDKVGESPRLDPHSLLILGLTAVLDRRDDPFNPTRGIYASAAAETTPSTAIPGAPAFGRAVGRVVGLVPFGTLGFGLQLEGSGGVLWSYDGTLAPVEWRFRLGGTSTVRGHRLDSIGPSGMRPGLLQDLGLVSPNYAPRRVPVGGNAFYRYSVQFQFPLPFIEDWRVVLFHDGGNALLYGAVPAGIDSSRDPILHTTIGIGLRRLTPIGPLRLDFAFRPDVFDEAGDVAMGELVQVHFAVGAL